MRNILAKLPRVMQGQMKRLIQQIFLASSHAQALERGRALIAQFRDRYPAPGSAPKSGMNVDSGVAPGVG